MEEEDVEEIDDSRLLPDCLQSPQEDVNYDAVRTEWKTFNFISKQSIGELIQSDKVNVDQSTSDSGCHWKFLWMIDKKNLAIQTLI